jgi:Tol biopolymer transport system component
MQLHYPIVISLLIYSSAASPGLSNVTLVGASKLFAPESYWPEGSDACPAFTPDGRTVLFTHSTGAVRSIMISHLRKGVWSTPEVASFSGTWRDIEPAMAPDGSYLVFISNRPAIAGGEPLTGFFGGASRPGAGGNIWRVNREGDGWGEPVRLPNIVNGNSAIYSPAIARDGSIYFNQPDPITKRSHIYRAQATNHGFDTPIALTISDGTIAGYDAAIAPDESFIVFSSDRAPASPGQSLLFVAFAQNRNWTVPQALQPATEGLEARFGPNLKILYFSAETPSSKSDSTDTPRSSRIFQIPMLLKTQNAIGPHLMESR